MLKTMLVAVVVLLTYCLIPIYVGHGDVPAALVLIAGIGSRAPEYLSVAVLGWVGIGSLVVAASLARRRAGPGLLASTDEQVTVGNDVARLPVRERAAFGIRSTPTLDDGRTRASDPHTNTI
jgi:hypothetical protein